MKNVSFIVLMLLCTYVSAQDSVSIKPPLLPPYSVQESGREKIQTRDLPEAIKESLKSQEYTGWTIDAAYKARMHDSSSPESEGTVIYIVELKRREEKVIIRFDRGGRRLDDDGWK
jgi:hypothetical protein